MIDPTVAAALATSRAHLLRALADASALDLALAPVVVTSPPGVGLATLLKGVAAGLGGSLHIVRPDDDRVTPNQVRSANVFLIDEPASRTRLDAAMQILRIGHDARVPVIVVLSGREGEEAAMLADVHSATGIHHALVPTVRMTTDASVRQPLTVVGRASIEGSKCGLRFLEVETSEPYEHMVRVRIEAEDDQDDDDLNEALSAIHDGDVAIRFEERNGSHVARARDVVAMG